MKSATTPASTEGPVASTEVLAASTEGSAASTEGSAASTKGPVASTEGPATSTEGSAASTKGSAASTKGPVASTKGPATSTEGPAASTEGPAASTEGLAESTEAVVPHTVTLISPESIEQRDFAIVTQPNQPSTAVNEDPTASTTNTSSVTNKDSSTEDTLSEALRKSRLNSEAGPATLCSGAKSEIKCIPGLFVFGGMDTCGHIHGDCFVLCPRPSLLDTHQ